MQTDGAPGKGEPHKAQDTFQQVPVQWSTRGHLCRTEVPSTDCCYSPQEQGTTTAVSATGQITDWAFHQLQEVLKLLGRQERLPSSSYVFIHPNIGLSSVKKKTHLIFLHLHSKLNDSRKRQKRIAGGSKNKNFLKSLAENFASYLATERDLWRV